MDGEDARADSPVGTVPAAELTEQAKADQQRAQEAGWTEQTAFNYEEFARAGADDAEWFGAARVFEWNPEEYGDVAPRIPELEEVLFGGEFQQRKGEHLNALELDVVVAGPEKLQPLRQVSCHIVIGK